eukprot:TRINITY_DN7820_c0_g1_i2.p1 TRINITY_DN7820_c0_g1~~TRINITY_DN7820_c0_g1_i2.p1  ORF type:complete len:830 (+),score=177.68 TRINITY_DN7820_c0_g1_i2:70-2559(+)
MGPCGAGDGDGAAVPLEGDEAVAGAAGAAAAAQLRVQSVRGLGATLPLPSDSFATAAPVAVESPQPPVTPQPAVLRGAPSAVSLRGAAACVALPQSRPATLAPSEASESTDTEAAVLLASSRPEPSERQLCAPPRPRGVSVTEPAAAAALPADSIVTLAGLAASAPPELRPARPAASARALAAAALLPQDSFSTAAPGSAQRGGAPQSAADGGGGRAGPPPAEPATELAARAPLPRDSFATLPGLPLTPEPLPLQPPQPPAAPSAAGAPSMRGLAAAAPLPQGSFATEAAALRSEAPPPQQQQQQLAEQCAAPPVPPEAVEAAAEADPVEEVQSTAPPASQRPAELLRLQDLSDDGCLAAPSRLGAGLAAADRARLCSLAGQLAAAAARCIGGTALAPRCGFGVGDTVVAHDGRPMAQTADGWSLQAGEAAEVVAVNSDGDIRLRNARGAETAAFLYPRFFRLAAVSPPRPASATAGTAVQPLLSPLPAAPSARELRAMEQRVSPPRGAGVTLPQAAPRSPSSRSPSPSPLPLYSLGAPGWVRPEGEGHGRPAAPPVRSRSVAASPPPPSRAWDGAAQRSRSSDVPPPGAAPRRTAPPRGAPPSATEQPAAAAALWDPSRAGAGCLVSPGGEMLQRAEGQGWAGCLGRAELSSAGQHGFEWQITAAAPDCLVGVASPAADSAAGPEAVLQRARHVSPYSWAPGRRDWGVVYSPAGYLHRLGHPEPFAKIDSVRAGDRMRILVDFRRGTFRLLRNGTAIYESAGSERDGAGIAEGPLLPFACLGPQAAAQGAAVVLFPIPPPAPWGTGPAQCPSSSGHFARSWRRVEHVQ